MEIKQGTQLEEPKKEKRNTRYSSEFEEKDDTDIVNMNTESNIKPAQEENKVETEKKEGVIKAEIVETKEVYIGKVEYIYQPVEICFRFAENNALKSNYMMN
jgi:hypothetical protein